MTWSCLCGFREMISATDGASKHRVNIIAESQKGGVIASLHQSFSGLRIGLIESIDIVLRNTAAMNIPVGAQVFDLVFHPTSSIVYTALLTGEVKAFRYNDQGQHQSLFSLKPSHRSCRALTISENGQQLWAVGKSKGLWCPWSFK